MINSKTTYIVGAGSLGRELASWMRLHEYHLGPTHDARRLRFVDDAVAGAIRVDELSAICPGTRREVYVAIADPRTRERVYKRLNDYNVYISTYAHPSAILSEGAGMIQAGGLVLPFAAVSVNATVGRGLIVNTHSAIGHDVELGEFCTLASHVTICGRVKVGRCVEFGAGAVVHPGVTIGDGAKIAAGAIVFKDVKAGETVFGNPARRLTHRIDYE